MAAFESRFFEKTSNKWADREYFQAKPGKHILMRKE
jgi:hypothetical protein